MVLASQGVSTEERYDMTINFSPYASNVLDYIDKPLRSKDGKVVKVSRSGINFVIYVNGQYYQETSINTQISSWLNQMECEADNG
jgi:hypothetical protein